MTDAGPPDVSANRRANTVAQVLPLVVGYGLAFGTTPIVVDRLGLREFGVWAISGALAQYGALLDLGIGRSITRFVALHRARGEFEAEGQVVGTSIFALSILTVLLTALAWAFGSLLRDPLSFETGAQARLVLVCAMLILGFGLLSQGLCSASYGRGRMINGNVAGAIGKALSVLSGLGALFVQPDIEAFAVGNAIGSGAGLLATIAVLMLRDGGISLGRPSAAMAREQLSFGIKGQVHGISELVVFQSDKLVIGIIVGPAAAGAYELGNRAALAAREIAVLAGNAVVPELAHDFAVRGLEAVRGTYVHLTRVTTAFGLIPLLLAAAIAPIGLDAWLGDAPTLSVAVVAVLSLAYTTNVATSVATNASNAIGRPGLPARSGVLTALLNVVLAVPLTLWLGSAGVLIATATAVTLGAGYGLWLFHHALDLPLGRFFAAMGGYVLGIPAMLVVAVPAYVLAPQPRLESAALLLVLSIVFVALFVPVAIRRGFLPQLRRR